jgi:hypothetical protein
MLNLPACDCPTNRLDIDNINLECLRTWALLQSGLTRGVFQLETPLGRHWVKKCQVNSINDLSDVIAMIRPGTLECISGDTKIIRKIYQQSSGRHRFMYLKMTLKEVYDRFNRVKTTYRNFQNIITSFNIESNNILDNEIISVVHNGKQEIWKPAFRIADRRINLPSKRYNLKCTLNHRLLTWRNGWKKLEDIEIGERVALINHGVDKTTRKNFNYKHIAGTRNFKDIAFANYEHKCIFCNCTEAVLDVHHIDGNRYTNNHPDNLCFVCPNHHRLISVGRIDKTEIVQAKNKYRLPISKLIIWGEYIGKDYIGLEDVYDIEVKSPHNYIAGNVIVHNCKIGGLSLPNIYATRKTTGEQIEYIHPILEPILKSTQGIITYQEQALSIAKELAGFTLEEADLLRRAAGKKLPEEMAKVKTLFLTKAKDHGILNEHQAEEIFGWIEKSQRYSFNRCTSKNTYIRRLNFTNKYKSPLLSVEEMFKVRNNIEYAKSIGRLALYKKWKLLGHYGHGLSMCADGRVRPNIIRNILFSGQQEVFRITLADESNIEVTANHKFPTHNGIKLVSNLSVGDLLFKCGVYEKTKKRYGRKIGEKGYPRFGCEIVSIESIGIQNVYDIEMDAPNHNFVTDQNIITCNSHSVSYAMLGYWSAYCKAHFPVQFFHSWLNFAKWKMNPAAEIKDLVRDAKNFNVRVLPPRLFDFAADVYSEDQTVRFGLLTVKKVGETVLKKMVADQEELSATHGNMSSWPWLKFLVLFSDKIRNDALKNIIKVGGLDHYGISRRQLEFELDQWGNLSKIEKEWAIQHYAEFKDLRGLIAQCALPRKNGGGCANINRTKKLEDIIKLIDNPPCSFKDDIYTVSLAESSLLGVSLTYDELLLTKKPENTWTCSKLLKKKPKDTFYLAGKIEAVRDYTIKSGKQIGRTMGFITLVDNTGSADNIVAFPNIMEEFRPELVEGNTILLCANYNVERQSIVINQVWGV